MWSHSVVDGKPGMADPQGFAGNQSEKSLGLPMLVSAARAARELSVSRWSVYQLCRANRLRTVRVGRRILIPRTELERFVAPGSEEKS
jgi:excisionase family DNA binding protein